MNKKIYCALPLLGSLLIGCGGSNDSLSRQEKNERVTKQLSESSDLFTTSDMKITIESFGYWDGGAAIDREFVDLSEQQIEALQQFFLEDNPGECWTDQLGHWIEITQSDGSIREYYANSSGSMCDDYQDSFDQVVNFESVQNLYDVSGCIFAQNVAREIAEANIATINSGCHHGFFYGPAWFKLDIKEPSTIFIEGHECKDREEMSLQLYDQEGLVVIKEGEPTGTPGCQNLRQVIEQPGTYFLKATGAPGDNYFEVTTE